MNETPPEVVVARDPTPITNPNRIAIVWPTRCANETSATQRGDAETRDEVAAIDCALEMSALERVLVTNGFEVFHWDAIRRRALVNEITPEAAAEQLGIGLLLRVNSFERTGIIPGERAGWQRRYFESDRDHAMGPPATVQPVVADRLDAHAIELENEITREGRLAVTLDVTAVHVPSGEVRWFYRWTHQDAQQEAISRRVFVYCRGVLCSEHDLATAPPGPRSGSTRELVVQGNEDGAQRMAYARLMVETIHDLVGRLRQTTPTPTPPRAPARTEPPPAVSMVTR
jgi:hypothetical protein